VLGLKREDFGSGFLFGAATSAHQIEGGWTDGRGSSIWDQFAAVPGNVADGRDASVACDHYHRWAADLDLVANAGFDAYRFSFAWPRIIPSGTGAANEQGLGFYDRLVDGMLERGLKPFATLYHWDLPSALQDRGGWGNRDIAGWFADYAALIARRFGDRLEATATLNEPWCTAYLGYISGRHAPGITDLRAGVRAMHHVLLAHGAGIDALRAGGARNLGVVLNLEKSEPASSSDDDADAARLWDGLFNRWYLAGVCLGEYPTDIVTRLRPHLPDGWVQDLLAIGRRLDWLGINYYTRALLRHDPGGGAIPLAKVGGPLETTDIGWEIYPEGLTELLIRVARDYTGVPIFITENGMAEVAGLDDQRRIRFHAEHLRAVLDARRAGVDVRGYFAWSLLDNFEWAEGYAKRFGLVEVDFETLERTPRASYRAFQQLLRTP
jgi:beta-glucosidase